ncbi:hypothetical protein H9655_14930 [Cytobacillus sp. Sa5YUA1]|uniref:Uncharacterized protein n=1 Tax=Cytobacillus stercorigallinarum TaxID=2762240 RepID=A0ABR8QS09_9BACI|nr:hypothetical protein [Cytobacillus stercorigallinarum]MBD7938326.1 hypothetical protein [Cytobacillus stercorigallinarum]
MRLVFLSQYVNNGGRNKHHSLLEIDDNTDLTIQVWADNGSQNLQLYQRFSTNAASLLLLC